MSSGRRTCHPFSAPKIYDGETYDARKTQANWDKSTFNDKQWKAAEVIQPHEPEIVWQYFQPIREEKRLSAKELKSPAAGIYIYDFEQNLSGVARIRADGPAGTDVKLRFGEEIESGRYALCGEPAHREGHRPFHPCRQRRRRISTDVHLPRFPIRRGFRIEEEATAQRCEGSCVSHRCSIHRDAQDRQLYDQPIVEQYSWGQRSNFIGVPTDCPQRDERLGWAADAQVFWRTATYNMDLRAFSRKFGADLRGTQVGTDMYGDFCAGHIEPESRSRHGMERCWRHHPLDVLDADWR